MGEFEVGQLAQELFLGYMGYASTSVILKHPATRRVVNEMEAANNGPAPVAVARIYRKDGSEIVYSVSHAFGEIRAGEPYQHTYDRLWLAGAVLTLGDRLADDGYFDRGPDLELIRHLRNGIAHGNVFELRRGEPKRPGRFTGPEGRSKDGATTLVGDAVTFEITRALHGHRVLFDFMGPGDVCDLLQFVSWRLIRIGNGDPPLDWCAQRP